MGVYGETHEASEASTHRIGFIPIHFSIGKGLVVRGPNHGPRVDVEQGTARAWRALTITHAQRKARILAAVHASGNGAVVPGWNQRQFAQNVRDSEGNNINYRLWGWQVHAFGSNLGSAGPIWADTVITNFSVHTTA